MEQDRTSSLALSSLIHNDTNSPTTLDDDHNIPPLVIPDIPPILTGHNNNNNQTSPPTTKPISKARSSKPHKPRSPSPSPPPAPPPPPPLQTIRLEIKLGGPDNYAVDIGGMARDTGQRPPTPTRPPVVVSDTEDDDEQGKSKPKKKRKNPGVEYYDVSDPFIDDSELDIDQRTYFAQTKQQGFYVSSGEVALLKDKTPKKPKSSRNPLHMRPSTSAKASTAAVAAAVVATPGNAALALPAATKKEKDETPATPQRSDGTKDCPVNVSSRSDSDVDLEDSKVGVRELSMNADGEGADPRTGEKRKRYLTVVEGGKKRKIVDLQSFDPLIQREVEVIKAAVAKESWDQKGKFPATLKPMLAQLAILAIKLDEYDEHFFNLMPTLFPYNKFTMSKLIKRTIFHEHITLLMARQDSLLTELAEQAKAGFVKAEEEWEKSVLAWDKRQEKLRLEAASGAGGASGSGGTDSTGPTRHPTEEMDVDQPPQPPAVAVVAEGGTAAGKEGKEGKDISPQQHPPAKKYRLTESMKAIVWQLVLLSNECCRLENEKNTLEGSVIQVSEQGLRKALYQKIVAAFPEGWLSSGQISRDVSAMKKKFEKEAMEQEL